MYLTGCGPNGPDNFEEQTAKAQRRKERGGMKPSRSPINIFFSALSDE